jgi:NAD(P)-dependent dehydrogenase (short-subunit alcohol dehydrogenase family)
MGEGVTDARTAFVTGGSRGIGRACAVALAEAGHRVAFCYSSDDDGAKATRAAVEKAGADTLAVRADIRDPAAVDSAFGEIEQALGPVELLVNNAGTTEDGLVARMTDDNGNASSTRTTGGSTRSDAAPKMMRAVGPHRQHLLGRSPSAARQRTTRRRRPGSWAGALGRPRARAAQRHLQRRRTGPYHDLDDRGPFRRVAGQGGGSGAVG